MGDEFNVENNDVNDINIEDSSSSEIPMTEQKPIEYEYNARGKLIKEPIEKILQRASQGYDYAQHMNDFKVKNQEFEQRYKLYEDIDKYAQANPEWWKQVHDSFQSQNTSLSFSNNSSKESSLNMDASTFQNNPELAPIISELNELRKFRDEYTSDKQKQYLEAQAKERESADNKLKEEINSIQKQYSWVNFNQPDVDGKSLEVRVMEHAVQNGIKSFKTAFKDFYHDELVKRAQMEGKEAAAKEVQKKTKLGLLGESPTPTKGIKSTDVKGKSYSDLTQEALRELGL